jgi:hypothetical protein
MRRRDLYVNVAMLVGVIVFIQMLVTVLEALARR